jgi:hypothetical protein
MTVEEPRVQVPPAEGGDGGAGEAGRVPSGVAGTKVFREHDQDQALLLPRRWRTGCRKITPLAPSTRSSRSCWISQRSWRSTRTSAARRRRTPRLMLKILLYGYATGVLSSRKIARRWIEDVAFRFLVANQQPDFRSVARFRRRHLAAVEDLYVQVLQIAHRAGLLELGQVALDGTKLQPTPAGIRP